MEQRFSLIVRFQVTADSAEDAEEIIETVCEKAASSHPEGELSYEGIEDIEEEEPEE